MERSTRKAGTRRGRPGVCLSLVMGGIVAATQVAALVVHLVR